MPTILKTKNSVTTTVVPTTLQQGELAVNITDRKMWVGNAATTPVQLFGAGADGSFANLAYTGTLTGGTGIVNLGSGQFYKDASGNIGLGTSSPVSSGGYTSLTLNNATNSGYVVLQTNGTTTSDWYVSGGTTATFRGVNVPLALTATGANYISSSTNGTERMRIDSSGNVMIGTTSQQWKFDVYNASSTVDTVIGVGNNNTSGTTKGARLQTYYSNISMSALGHYWDGGGFVSYLDAYSNLRFTIGASEKMRLDGSGNLGIGCTPARTLEVNGIGKFLSTVTIGGTAGSTDYNGYFTNQSFANNSNNTTVSLGTFSTRPLIFATNATERMRIDSDGNVLVGATATSNNAKFFVTGSVADRFVRFNNSQPSAPFGVIIEYTAAAPNDTGKSFLFCADNSATRADIRSNGGLANYSGNNVNLSDAREKTNVELAGSYLNKICSIPVKTFNYIDQNREEDDGLTLGVIAQDVQAVAPELVSESDWGTKDEPKMRLSIYQTDLQYALMKAIQELKAELDSVKAELQTLKGN